MTTRWRSEWHRRTEPATAREWDAAAFHESGHVVASVTMSARAPAFVTVELDRSHNDGVSGVVLHGCKLAPLQFALAALAGPAAESLFSGRSLEEIFAGPGRTDLGMATRALTFLDSPPKLSDVLAEAETLILARWARVEMLAGELARYGFLGYAEAMDIIQGTCQ